MSLDTEPECHIPEWADLMDVSVPEGVCKERDLPLPTRKSGG